MVNLQMLSIRFYSLIVASCLCTYAVAFGADPAALAKGKKVYLEYCKTCHMPNGQGMPGVYPPVANSDYIKATPKVTLIKEVVNGKHGKITVNGKVYNGVMAPMPKKYNCDDIACVLTYVFTSFGNSKGAVSVAEVRKACPKR